MKTEQRKKITASLIKSIKNGAPPWIKPWRSGATEPFPINATSGNKYSGINIMLLWGAALSKGYEKDRWLTFNQARKCGGSVKKGEKATLIVYARNVEKQNEDGEIDRFRVARTFSLFNVDQCKELPKNVQGQVSAEEELQWSPHEKAESFIDAIPAKIYEKSDGAHYSPELDCITMPKKSAFHSDDGWYSTLLHELVHWSGGKKRMAREGITGKHSAYSKEYAYEELIAEIGSAYLCAELGIEGNLNHANYLNSWAKMIENVPKMIFTASADASRAVDYLKGYQTATNE